MDKEDVIEDTADILKFTLMGVVGAAIFMAVVGGNLIQFVHALL